MNEYDEDMRTWKKRIIIWIKGRQNEQNTNDKCAQLKIKERRNAFSSFYFQLKNSLYSFYLQL